MTEIEELIKQAEGVLKRWHRPQPEERRRLSNKSWQEILENRGYDADKVTHLATRPGGI